MGFEVNYDLWMIVPAAFNIKKKLGLSHLKDEYAFRTGFMERAMPGECCLSLDIDDGPNPDRPKFNRLTNQNIAKLLKNPPQGHKLVYVSATLSNSDKSTKKFAHFFIKSMGNKVLLLGGYQTCSDYDIFEDFRLFQDHRDVLQDFEEKKSMEPAPCQKKNEDMLKWTEMPSSGSAIRCHHTSTLYKNFIITFAGCSINSIRGDIEIFDLHRYERQNIGPSNAVPIPRYHHTACLFETNKIIIFGGLTLTADKDPMSRILMNEIGMLIIRETQPFLVEWRTVEPAKGDNIYRYAHTANIYQDKMYVFGGYGPENKQNNEVWCLDMNNQFSWIQCHPSGRVPGHRAEHSSVLYHDKLYIFGGVHFTKAAFMNTPLNDFWILDLSLMKWILLAGLDFQGEPRTRSRAAMVEYDGMIYLFGGIDGAQCVSDEVFCHNTSQDDNKWKSYQTLEHHNLGNRFGHSAVSWDGKIITCGGSGMSLWDISIGSPFGTSCDPGAFYLCLDINENKDVSDNSTDRDSLTENSQPDTYVLNFEDKSYVSQFKALLLNERYSDISIKVENRLFPAHKVVLATRCRYFDDQFQNDKDIKVVTLEDIKATTFEVILQYIYCNEVNITYKSIEEVWSLSNELTLPSLADGCRQFLADMITVENFVETANTAEKFESIELKNSVIKFGVENARNLRQQNAFSSLSKDMLKTLIDKLT